MNKKQIQNIDLSIVVTAHNEGLIAHKTMLSIFEAVEQLADSIAYEIIISLDSPDDVTKNYFSRYESSNNIRIIPVKLADLSKSRNNAVAAALGNIVTFIDADDLMSNNWLGVALESYAANPESIIHPEYSITFGDDNLIWKKRDSLDKDFDTLCFIDNNLWDSPSLAKKDIFLDNPYYPNGNGIGYEDKHFNSVTLASDIKHVVAPRTVLFVRRKTSGSMLRQANGDRVTMAPSSLLSYEAIKAIDISRYSSPAKTEFTSRSKYLRNSVRKMKKSLRMAHNIAKQSSVYLQAVEPLKKRYHQKLDRNISNLYPNWLIDSWKQIHVIENSTFPSKSLLASLPAYNSDRIEPGLKYTALIKQLSHEPDTLFFVPHLIKGGADMVFINYANELKMLHPDWNISVLQTEVKESVWKDKLNPSLDYINLYELLNGLDSDTQYRLLATLISQNSIRRIIIGNSQLAYDFVSNYQTLVKRLGINIYCFAFGEEFDDEGRLWGHIHTGIPRIYPVISKILTDNKNTINKLEKEYGFDRERFAVHYQPTAHAVREPVQRSSSHIKVLWASRVCKQKRPDILKKVSNILDSDVFTIDAYGQLEEGLTAEYFNNSKVNYKGAFNGISSLPTDDYDIYLYTSEGDGVPNVLQEITASGLPIVASNVGGVGEFVVTNKSGVLVIDHEKIEDYVSAIESLKDPSRRKQLTLGAQSLLRKEFAHKDWVNKIQKDIQ